MSNSNREKTQSIDSLVRAILEKAINRNTDEVCDCQSCQSERAQGFGEVPQKAFDGLPASFKWAAADKDGELWAYEKKPYLRGNSWAVDDLSDRATVIGMINLPDFAGSLTERQPMKNGSDATREMLAEGARYIMCKVSDNSDEAAISGGNVVLITGYDAVNKFVGKGLFTWGYAVPVNTQGDVVDFNK